MLLNIESMRGLPDTSFARNFEDRNSETASLSFFPIPCAFENSSQVKGSRWTNAKFLSKALNSPGRLPTTVMPPIFSRKPYNRTFSASLWSSSNPSMNRRVFHSRIPDMSRSFEFAFSGEKDFASKRSTLIHRRMAYFANSAIQRLFPLPTVHSTIIGRFVRTAKVRPKSRNGHFFLCMSCRMTNDLSNIAPSAPSRIAGSTERFCLCRIFQYSCASAKSSFMPLTLIDLAKGPRLSTGPSSDSQKYRMTISRYPLVAIHSSAPVDHSDRNRVSHGNQLSMSRSKTYDCSSGSCFPPVPFHSERERKTTRYSSGFDVRNAPSASFTAS